MSRINKTLLISFIIGLLLIGLGSGIAFVELNRIEYGGVKEIMQNEEQITDSHAFDLPNGNGPIYIDPEDYDSFGSVISIEPSIIEDATVGPNEIIIEITKPIHLITQVYEGNAHYDYDDDDVVSVIGEAVYYEIDSYTNEMQTFKAILDDLRNDRYYNYTVNYQVTVRIHPDNLSRVYIDR